VADRETRRPARSRSTTSWARAPRNRTDPPAGSANLIGFLAAVSAAGTSIRPSIRASRCGPVAGLPPASPWASAPAAWPNPARARHPHGQAWKPASERFERGRGLLRIASRLQLVDQMQDPRPPFDRLVQPDLQLGDAAQPDLELRPWRTYGIARRRAASVSLRCSSVPITLTQTRACADRAGLDMSHGDEADARIRHLALERWPISWRRSSSIRSVSLAHRARLLRLRQQSRRRVNPPPGSPFAG